MDEWQRKWVDYYEELELSPSATISRVRAVYRDLAKEYHPDGGAHPDGERMRRITAAHDVLTNPTKKQRYDHEYRRRNGIGGADARRTSDTSPQPNAGDGAANQEQQREESAEQETGRRGKAEQDELRREAAAQAKRRREEAAQAQAEAASAAWRQQQDDLLQGQAKGFGYEHTGAALRWFLAHRWTIVSVQIVAFYLGIVLVEIFGSGSGEIADRWIALRATQYFLLAVCAWLAFRWIGCVAFFVALPVAAIVVQTFR